LELSFCWVPSSFYWELNSLQEPNRCCLTDSVQCCCLVDNWQERWGVWQLVAKRCAVELFEQFLTEQNSWKQDWLWSLLVL